MKKYDKVVCIDNKGIDLIKDKVYTIKGSYGVDKCFYIIIDEFGVSHDGYYQSRFISLKDFRRNKLSRLEVVSNCMVKV